MNKIIYQQKGSIIAAVLCAIFGLWLISTPVSARIDDHEFEQIVEEQVQDDSSIASINSKIENKADEVRDLEERIDIYKQNIAKKQAEKITLETQISILEDKIEETKDGIEVTQIELEILQLEIEALQDQIDIAENDVASGKESLKQVLQQIYKFEQKTPLEITFSNATFSDFFSDLEYTNRVQTNVQDAVNQVQALKKILQEKKDEVKGKKAEVSVQKVELEVTQETLEGEEQYKNQLLEDTELSEEKFQVLLKQVRDEQSQIEGQIAALEKSAQEKILRIREQIQQKLEEQGEDVLTDDEREILDGTVSFIWPTYGTITCGFHCSAYPFSSSIGAHSGMDIGVSMGTSIKAASSGYVQVAKFDGTSSYSWVMIVHGNGFATLYGHLSRVDVAVDQYVRRGDVIGASGGFPGTPGAGSYSTGPHLHFEIRLDGLPQDPAHYLP